MRIAKLACCFGILFVASVCCAQMYTVTDLGSLGLFGELTWSDASGINASGEVIGESDGHCFRTAPNTSINAGTDDIGNLGSSYRGGHCEAYAINALGQVTGGAYVSDSSFGFHAFRTGPNRAINPVTDDLGTLGGSFSTPRGINDRGQVVGTSNLAGDTASHAFRTGSNRAINPATDDLGTLGGLWSNAYGINNRGQVVGTSAPAGDTTSHAFRTGSNRTINPATDDLGTLGGSWSVAYGINTLGQVVGAANIAGDATSHAFLTDPNRAINPATDDLGTLGGAASWAANVDNFGQVVGWASLPADTSQHAFLYSNGVMHDLNDLIPTESNCRLVAGQVGTVYVGTPNINDAGQVVETAACGGLAGYGHAVRLDPIYKAFVQRPINTDASSVFHVRRQAIPLKFTLTQYGAPTCALPPATVAVTRIAGGTWKSQSGMPFRIHGCQYGYLLSPRALGTGTYRIDISINGIMVGHAMFELKYFR